MSTTVPTVASTATVETVEQLLLDEAANFATINYIYVIESERLVGVISIRELFRTPKTMRVADLMVTNVVAVQVDEDQEVVARIAVQHSIKAVPVVDDAGRLLGVVAMDTILHIIRHETTEDFMHLAGATPDQVPGADLIDATARTHITKRLPWLLVGLIGGTVAAFVVSGFELVLAEYVAVAAFIPLVVYLADAVGGQILVIYIRSITLRPDLPLPQYLLREVRVNIVLGAVLAIAIAGISYLWHANVVLSVVLATSVYATVAAAMLIGLLLPWAFYRTGRDPAIASGPFATVIIDIVSLLIYFSVASLMLL